MDARVKKDCSIHKCCYYFEVKRSRSKNVVQVGFEPTPPKRLELESSALDHSAIEPLNESYGTKPY